jgi:hypothetical protein
VRVPGNTALTPSNTALTPSPSPKGDGNKTKTNAQGDGNKTKCGEFIAIEDVAACRAALGVGISAFVRMNISSVQNG